MISRYLQTLVVAFLSVSASALSAVLQFPDVASLALASSASNGDTALVAGYTTAGDGGGGTFVLDTASTAAPDNGTIFARTAGGRWLRVTSEIDVRMFGAKGDGVTNDRAAIQAAIDAAEARGYDTVHFGGRRYYVRDSTAEQYSTFDHQEVVNGISQIVTSPAFVRGILRVGAVNGSTGRLILAGEGATLYTDDERGGATLRPNAGSTDGTTAPYMLLVRGSFQSLEANDLSFERKVTGGTVSNPGNYALKGQTPTSQQLDYYDHPNGEHNRGGIFLFPQDTRVIDSITLKNVAFSDCHPAIDVCDPVPDRSFASYDGKVSKLKLDACSFLYPHGGNVFLDPPDYPEPSMASAGGVGVLLSSWIGNAEITNCDFDGAQGGDVSDVRARVSKDGFVFSRAERLVCTGNTLRHFDVEGIIHSPSDYLAYCGVNSSNPQIITMPAVGSDVEVKLQGGVHILPPDVSVGDTVFVGSGELTNTPPPVVNPNQAILSAGFMEITWIASDRATIRVKNVSGYLHNAPPGQTVNLDGSWLRSPKLSANNYSIISNNVIDCSPLSGVKYVADLSTGFGRPGIRINEGRATITQNHILNAVAGIMLWGDRLSCERMRNSVISENYIQMADPDCFVKMWLPSPPPSPPPGGTLVDIQVLRNVYMFGTDTIVDGCSILNNVITIPRSGPSDTNAIGRFSGISVNSSGNRVSGNSVTSGVLARAGGNGVGIAFAPEGHDNVAAYNSTRNLNIGLGAIRNQSSSFVAEDNKSTGDEVAINVSSFGLAPEQVVEFSPTSVGWYRLIYNAVPQQASGHVLLKCSEGAASHYFDANLAFDFTAYSSFRSLTQEYFSADVSADPVIDQVILAGEECPILMVHVERVPTAPIQILLKSRTVGLFLQPDTVPLPSGTASLNIEGSPEEPGFIRAVVALNSPHGLSASSYVQDSQAIYLLPTSNDTSASSALKGSYLIKAIKDNDELYIRVPAATPLNLTSVPFIGPAPGNNGWTAVPGRERYLQLRRNSFVLSKEIAIAGGNNYVPSINFGNNGDADTGIFQPNVSSVGIAVDGSLVARFDNGGIDVAAGTNNQPGYSFEGDDATGIFHPSVNTIAFATDGMERARIDNSSLSIGGGAIAGELRLMEPGGTDYTGFKSPALTAPLVYTLPAVDGASGQALVTNGSKTLSWSFPVLPGYLHGGELGNDPNDSSNDIDIAGVVCADSTDTVMLKGYATVKQIDMPWAAVSWAAPQVPTGGMFTGTATAATWYYFFAILKDSDGSVDYGFDTSLTASHRPAGYTYYRRLGSVYRLNSTANKAFFQDGDYFRWKTPTLDINTNALGTAGGLFQLTAGVPLGLKVSALMNIAMSDATANVMVYVCSPADTLSAPSASAEPLATIRNTVASVNVFAQIRVTTDASQQIAAKSSGSGSTFRASVLGYFDSRGK